MTDYLVRALPLLLALLVAVVSLPVLRRFAPGGSETDGWPLWRRVVLAMLAAAWLGSLGAEMKSVSDARDLRERINVLGRMIERDIVEGKELLGGMENDSDWSTLPRCLDKAVLDRYQVPVETWRTRTARTLATELPNSGADRRFLHVTERRPPGRCAQVDYVYWRLFDLLSNLQFIWESVDRYCLVVGPTCRAEQRESAARSETGNTRTTSSAELFYSSLVQVAAALLALMGAFFLYRLVDHVDQVGKLRAPVDEKIAKYAAGELENRGALSRDIADFRRKAWPRWTGLAFFALALLAGGCIVWPLYVLSPPGQPVVMLLALVFSLVVFFVFCGWQFWRLHRLRQIELPPPPR